MPVTIAVSPDIHALFPEAQIRLVTAHDLRNDHPWPAVAAALGGLEASLASGAWQPHGEADPRIASWHEAYRKFGTNPRRSRPSVEALGRRLAKTGMLPRISPAVDAYNYISVRFGVPAGAFDLDALDGDIVIRPARTGDHFTPLGQPELQEEPALGEAVYAMGSQVLTRHWNHRDCDASKVGPASRNVVFIIERISRAAVSDDVLDQAQQELAGLLADQADMVACNTLENPAESIPLM